MVVTEVRVNRYSPRSVGTCAEVTVVFDEVFAVHKVLVVSGRKGLFVAMPNTDICQDSDLSGNCRKRFIDIAHPLDKSFKEEIDCAVLEAYKGYKE